MDNKNLEFRYDIMSIIGLIITFASILLSLNLQFETTIFAIGIFLIIIASYSFLSMRDIVNKQGKEIKKLNEKIKLYRNISDLKSKVDLLFNMKKRGNIDIVEVLIRIIQIVAIIFAVYIIFKSLGAI